METVQDESEKQVRCLSQDVCNANTDVCLHKAQHEPTIPCRRGQPHDCGVLKRRVYCDPVT